MPGGLLYASFMLGEGEDVRSERLFANQNAVSFRAIVATVTGLDLLESWVETDRRPGRQDAQWFCVLCQRSDSI